MPSSSRGKVFSLLRQRPAGERRTAREIAHCTRLVALESASVQNCANQ